MAIFNGMFQVLPGKDDVARSFGKELAAPDDSPLPEVVLDWTA